MCARIVTAQIQPGKMEEARRIFEESVLPATKQLNGFKHLFMLSMPTPARG